MSDERLLSEALRAHAAGGVSTPRTDTSATATGSPGTDAGPGAPPSGRRRFRPLGRVRQPQPGGSTEQPPGSDQPADRGPATDVPAPRPGGPPPPPGYARGPMPPAPPTAPVRPHPTSGGFGSVGAPLRGPAGGAPVPRTAPPAVGYVPWSAVTVAWWSLVAVLAGGAVGAAVGVLSLLLPA